VLVVLVEDPRLAVPVLEPVQDPIDLDLLAIGPVVEATGTSEVGVYVPLPVAVWTQGN